MNTIDLQIQTTASDGKHSPREVIQMSKEQGLSVIAITDHDTIDGISEAVGAGNEFGVRVIPGIEMSVEEHDSHILGYGIDYNDADLGRELEKFKQERVARAKQIMEHLKKIGFSISWEEVLEEARNSSVMTSPHVVYAVMGKAENAEKLVRDGVISKFDFYDKYLSRGVLSLAKRVHISAKGAISLIHGARGAAIWSHPAINFQENYAGLEKFLQELIGWGVDGIEVFNPSHTEDDAEFLESLVKKYSLLKTAGSDFHVKEPPKEPNGKGLRPASTVGDYQTFGFSTEKIIPRLDEMLSSPRAR